MKIKLKGYLKIKNFEGEDYLDYNLNAQIENKIITYKDNDVDVSIDFNKKNIMMIRESEELKINFLFDIDKTTKGTYYLKESNKELPLEIFTDDLKILDNFLLIKYYLSLEKENLGIFEFSIKWEDIK